MPIFDHLGITVTDVPRAIAQYDPILTELGFRRHDSETSASWFREGETEFIVMPARDVPVEPHEHGRVGWQHLAFAVDSREDVERLHRIAAQAGWRVVREPKGYPRFTPTYYASFLEDADGIRIEFMHNPPSAPS